MKLCLIGSSRFLDRYIEANRRLTLEGHVVYSIAMISTSAGSAVVSEAEKQILDLVHLRKIQESEGVVLITDETGYIGFSTKREIQWTQMLGKSLYGSAADVPEALGDPEQVARRIRA